MVFQTAPPQPASKARLTWYSELVGGAEASQKGLGARTPQKLMLRSGTGTSSGQQRVNPPRRDLAVLHGIDNLAAAADAVAAGEQLRDAGRPRGANDRHLAAVQLQSR